MPTPIDYRSPGDEPPRGVTPDLRAFLIAVGEQAAVFLLYASTLDGGMRMKTCFIVAVAFWVVLIALVASRRGILGTTDRLFVLVGYPAMLVPCLIARGEL